MSGYFTDESMLRRVHRERAQILVGRGRDERHVGVAGEQALDLLEADLTAADDEAAAARELQAGDVERRVEHPLDAGLVADALAQLADAVFPGIGLCWHRP